MEEMEVDIHRVTHLPFGCSIWALDFRIDGPKTTEAQTKLINSLMTWKVAAFLLADFMIRRGSTRGALIPLLVLYIDILILVYLTKRVLKHNIKNY